MGEFRIVDQLLKIDVDIERSQLKYHSEARRGMDGL